MQNFQVDDILSGKITTPKIQDDAARKLISVACYELSRRLDLIRQKRGFCWQTSGDYTDWSAQANHFIAFATNNFRSEIQAEMARAMVSVHKLPIEISAMPSLHVFATLVEWM